jgi:GT2 family glycosyltransferase
LTTEVSVIIVNLNTKQLLEECLDSVYGEGSQSLEVIVIDNGSTDGSVEMVHARFPGVRVVKNEQNQGFAKPNNLGMRMATGRYLFLLNSDTIVRHGAIRTLSSFLDAHLEIAACGPKLVYPDGRLQKSVKGFPTLWTHLCDMLFLDKIFPRTRLFGRGELAYFDYERTQEVDHVMAAAFLIRREVVAETEGFDERFSIYYNDMDWCYRINKKGWKICYVHNAIVVHYLGKTVERLNRDFSHFEELYNNVMLFYQKHYGRGSVMIYKLILCIGFTIRVVGWTSFWLVRRTDRSRIMTQFSWKTLALGIQFWIPLPSS